MRSIPPSPLVGPTHAPSGHTLNDLECATKSTSSSSKTSHAAGGRKNLKVAIVTENFMPKVDGVTRTLSMLLEHLQAEGHEALVLGPSTPLTSYAGAEVVGTKGIPLLGVYRGLGLNFLRPRFIRKIREFKPDVCLFVDPIWLCAQTIPAVQYTFPNLPCVSSYHTNLALYASLFGLSWLTPVMWSLQRYLHGRCQLSFCPSPSTTRMLDKRGFENVRLWPRGVDVDMFRPSARDFVLRQSWYVEPIDLDQDRPSPRVQALSSSLNDDLPPLHLPPPYSAVTSTFASASKLVCLYVGRISWEKNLRLLIEAMRGLQEPDVATGRPACQLVFVGDGPARSEAEALCQTYGLGALFLGFKKGQELAAAYASSDIFAFPSFTETFGQVVSEAQASGIPVVGLQAEGVSDLVEHRKTGLLLNMHDLLPAKSFSSASSSPPYSPSSSAADSLIPDDPHSLMALDSPTFPLAVSLYRSLLVEAATNSDLRREMASAAYETATKRSWFGAMEKLVDGFREVAVAREARAAPLDPSRTSTIELDVVYDSQPRTVEGETVEGASTGTTTPKRKRLLRLNGVLRRTGGRLRESSVSLQPLRSWLAPRHEAERSGGSVMTKFDGDTLAVRFVEVAFFFLLLYVCVSLTSRLELLSFVTALRV